MTVHTHDALRSTICNCEFLSFMCMCWFGVQDPESPPMPSWLSVSGFQSGVVVGLLCGQPVD